MRNYWKQRWQLSDKEKARKRLKLGQMKYIDLKISYLLASGFVAFRFTLLSALRFFIWILQCDDAAGGCWRIRHLVVMLFVPFFLVMIIHKWFCYFLKIIWLLPVIVLQQSELSSPNPGLSVFKTFHLHVTLHSELYIICNSALVLTFVTLLVRGVH